MRVITACRLTVCTARNLALQTTMGALYAVEGLQNDTIAARIDDTLAAFGQQMGLEEFT